MNQCNRKGGAMHFFQVFTKRYMPLLVVLVYFTVAAGNIMAQDTAPGYKIGRGDVLSINIWKEPDLSLEAVTVRNDGYITFPLIDDIKAAGLTPMELKQVIEQKISEFMEAPAVTVTLVNPVSQQYYILGEVQETGAYPLIKKLTVLQAFALAKGFTEWASKKKIIVCRKEGDETHVFQIDYTKILKGDFSADIYLKADDTVIVP